MDCSREDSVRALFALQLCLGLEKLQCAVASPKDLAHLGEPHTLLQVLGERPLLAHGHVHVHVHVLAEMSAPVRATGSWQV
jgi:hypothetical protein